MRRGHGLERPQEKGGLFLSPSIPHDRFLACSLRRSMFSDGRRSTQRVAAISSEAIHRRAQAQRAWSRAVVRVHQAAQRLADHHASPRRSRSPVPPPWSASVAGTVMGRRGQSRGKGETNGEGKTAKSGKKGLPPGQNSPPAFHSWTCSTCSAPCGSHYPTAVPTGSKQSKGTDSKDAKHIGPTIQIFQKSLDTPNQREARSPTRRPRRL
eukprot:8177350-Pyramimonas_sp.AAC.1